MSLTDLLILLVGGVGAGLIGYLAGLASLVSYPLLLSIGLPPVAANVTNTLGLVGAGIGSTTRGARDFLRSGDRDGAVLEGIIAAVGGVVGAVLLLTTGEESFRVIVPWLVALAAALLLASPRIMSLSSSKGIPSGAYHVLLFFVCIYGGYFGAGSGVIYLALTSLAAHMDFGKAVFMKSLLLAISNLTASFVFIGFGPVNWLAAITLGIGCVGGGYLGPIVQQLIPAPVLRWIIGLAGFGLAGWLWFH